MVVIGMLVLEVAESIFLMIKMICVPLLIYRKKYGDLMQNHIRELRKSIKLSQENLLNVVRSQDKP